MPVVEDGCLEEYYRRTLGDCLDNEVSVNSRVLEVAYNALPVYLGNKR